MGETAALFVKHTRKEDFDSHKYSWGKALTKCYIMYPKHKVYPVLVFFSLIQDGIKTHHPSFYILKTAREENKA